MSRRSWLRGSGAAAIALPCLDAMGTSLGQQVLAADQVATPPRKLVAINSGLGFHAPHLFPDQPGTLSPSTPYLKQIRNHLDRVTLLSGLSHPEQQGNNGHASSMTFLTSAQRPGLAGFRNTISLDQQIAGQVGYQTRFPCLVLSTRGGDSLSWTAGGVPIPGESSPAKLYKAMFIDGKPDEVDREIEGLRRGRSILDVVAERASQLERQLGARDRHKLGEYFASIRDLEIRLHQSEDWVRRPKPHVDVSEPRDITDKQQAIERQRLMYDVMALALQTDSTRVITFHIGGLNAVPQIKGVQSDWHGLSHHGKDPDKIAELRLIEEAEFAAFGDFLGKLRSIKEADGTLLDQTMVMFGSNLGNASAHD
ncbi:MAG: DUF1552 domain-containing protein [Planctomycetota bacterium]